MTRSPPYRHHDFCQHATVRCLPGSSRQNSLQYDTNKNGCKSRIRHPQGVNGVAERKPDAPVEIERRNGENLNDLIPINPRLLFFEYLGVTFNWSLWSATQLFARILIPSRKRLRCR